MKSDYEKIVEIYLEMIEYDTYQAEQLAKKSNKSAEAAETAERRFMASAFSWNESGEIGEVKWLDLIRSALDDSGGWSSNLMMLKTIDDIRVIVVKSDLSGDCLAFYRSKKSHRESSVVVFENIEKALTIKIHVSQ